jgi:CheY-like chemotaxis protein
MVYGFIKQSNGHVAIYSEPGLGTTVKLYLPAAYPANAIPDSEEAQPDVPHGSGTVLVVEDDPFVRGYAVGCIEGLGYSVVTAANGPEAITKLNAMGEKIDLLFSDIVMPGGIGGRDLAERACEMRPGLKVLLTSGYQIDAIAGRAGLSENMTILHKPYRKADLARRISELLQ